MILSLLIHVTCESVTAFAVTIDRSGSRFVADFGADGSFPSSIGGTDQRFDIAAMLLTYSRMFAIE